MATCVEVSKTEYPTTYNNENIQAMEGTSLLPAFFGSPINREYIAWEHEANGAIRMGDWKLVRKGRMGTGELLPWELYNMANDRSELNDLALDQPERVQQMELKWKEWASRTRVQPWPWNKN